ncbi:MAG: MMPL family transporter [Halovenus sp.]
MTLPERVADTIASRTGVAIVVMLLVVGGVGAGAPMVESVSSLDQFQSDSAESEKLAYIEDNFTVDTETTLAQVVVRGDNVLSRDSLIAMLEYQQQLRANGEINRTLFGEQPTFSVANAVATAAYRRARQMQGAGDANQGSPERPALTIEEQIQQLRDLDDEQLSAAIAAALGGGGNGASGTDSVLSLMPRGYAPGEPTAEATILSVTQERELDTDVDEAAGPRTMDAQLEMRALGERMSPDEYLVFGSGIIAHEINASMQDSLLIVGPLAVLFVLLALTVAYRDLLDIVLGLFGIGAVLVMTFGFMGWTGIDFSQVFIAVPVLLIGLSIDYAIHIFMRHREHREEGEAPSDDIRSAMSIGLAGVGVALVFVTATTAIGFLSNVTSPVPPIQEFGIVSAVGIVSALFVFGVLVPAVKIELDEWLESRGFDRRKRAFGTGGGRFSQTLTVGAKAAQNAPVVVIAVVVLLGIAGAAGAASVDTSFNQEDFLADDPPEWMTELPEPFAPGTYTAKPTLQFVNERFIRSDANAEILIEGDVTDGTILERVAAATADAGEQSATQRLASGEPAIDSPLSVLRTAAARDAAFRETVAGADTDGDGVPDRNIETVYDQLFETAPEAASQVIHRTEDGEYRALRMTVAVRGDAENADITDQMQSVAAGLSGDGLVATATGGVVLNTIVQDQLLDTVVESLAITLVVVFLFLMAAYRVTNGSALLGAVTLTPVAIATAWIGGSMFLLDIPFNVITGMILSLTIGLGVAYSIHISERYTLELARQGSVWTAMETAVTGTGGALLGSAATTVLGFGVLVFAILPPLQQFGLITALSIVYAFVGSVLVLPTLLAFWTRIAGPEWARAELAPGDAESDNGGPTVTLERQTDAASGAFDVAPGERVTVDVEVPAADSRLALYESVAGASLAVETVEPAPEQVVEGNGSLYVLWDLDGQPARLVYSIAVPETADHGLEVRFSGTVMSANGDRPVTGTGGLTVRPPDRDSAGPTSTRTDDALATAAERYADGELTHEEFERAVRDWLAGDGHRSTD